MKATLKQLLGLLLVFAFLTATGANLTQGARASAALLAATTDSTDTTADTASDSTTAVRLDTCGDSVAGASDSASDDTLADTSADTTVDTDSNTTADSSAVISDSSSDSTADSTADSLTDTSQSSDSARGITGTETTTNRDTLSDTAKSDSTESVGDTTTPPEPVKLSPREQAEEHYQAALDYAKDPSKLIEMVGELTLAIKSDPEFAPPYIMLGVHNYRKRNYKDAEENLKKAAELVPSDTTALSNLGKLYVTLRKQEEAERVFLAAIDADKNFTGGFRELGDLYYRQQRYKESIDVLDEYNQRVSDDPLAHFRAGKAYRKLKEYDEAIEEYKKALSIKEDFASAYSALGQIYLAEERFEEAVNAYRKSVHFNPKSYRSYFNLAVAIQSAHPDSLDESLAAWRQALRMARNNPRVTDIIPIAEIQIKELKKQKSLRSQSGQSAGGSK